MQIVYSCGAGWGAMISMASHNTFSTNCYRNARLTMAINASTSIFAGFVIFSIIGFLAHTTGSEIKDVVTDGPGLVFVVYPTALANMPLSQLWSILFFVMLFTLGLDSQFGTVELLMTCLLEEFPAMFKTKLAITMMRVCICLVLFLLGIPCVMQGGVYVLQTMDWYSCVFSVMIVMISECLVVGWIYGAERFYRDIMMMIGYRPAAWWKLSWCFLTPAVITTAFLSSLILMQPVTYGSYSYPSWAIIAGWMLAFASVIPLPTVAFLKILEAKGPFLSRIKYLLKPTYDYGPSITENKTAYMISLKQYKPRVAPIGL